MICACSASICRICNSSASFSGGGRSVRAVRAKSSGVTLSVGVFISAPSMRVVKSEEQRLLRILDVFQVGAKRS
jgi:hypothetical protein